MVTVVGLLMLPLVAMVLMLTVAETDAAGRVFGYACLAVELVGVGVLCWLGLRGPWVLTSTTLRVGRGPLAQSIQLSDIRAVALVLSSPLVICVWHGQGE